MGKAGRNETKRMAANFLNGAAVALLAAGYIGPLLTEDHQILVAVTALLGSWASHFMAVQLAGYLED
jgi:hypothetical protein